MALVRKTAPFFFNSDPTAGARNISVDGSRFDIQMDTPVSVPREAVGVNLSVVQATIWNTAHNFSAEIGNNIFKYSYLGVAYTLTIPDGQYSLDAFETFVHNDFVERGFPADLIDFYEDSATQKVVLIFKTPQNTYVDFTVANSCREVFGFESRLAPLQPNTQTTPLAEAADNIAAFNRVNSFLIKSNFISNGIPTNSSASGVIASVPIDVRSGSQIVYSPRIPVSIDASELVGQSKNYFSVSLTDQLERPVNTNGEKYTVLVVLEYFIPMKI